MVKNMDKLTRAKQKGKKKYVDHGPMPMDDHKGDGKVDGNDEEEEEEEEEGEHDEEEGGDEEEVWDFLDGS